ncbi:hypothetical protein AKJ64_04345 [candidate division MSBL1 archaeon SCGC-AAA259E17]|uniref:BFN domain-containing protein n=1 Tax=candidate division MSBL1 archaeon SCGC-AAA259E17 TaxID=1698263 RepID=A0A133UCK1_9EURY|nr:hypothetical protein AKJ64_04345 [candidate division MSBL1 archaeon SCGC-AAA259E17]
MMGSLRVQPEGVYRTDKGFMVALRSEDDGKVLPIFMSGNQAQSIQRGLSGKEPPRPLTHDIFLQIMGDQGLTVESVTVDDLIGNTFTAELRLARGGRTFPYDVRPSDGIALAVRMDADIYVSKVVMDRAGKNVEGSVEDPRELALRRFEDKSQE